jgi:hypothetical protein
LGHECHLSPSHQGERFARRGMLRRKLIGVSPHWLCARTLCVQPWAYSEQHDPGDRPRDPSRAGASDFQMSVAIVLRAQFSANGRASYDLNTQERKRGIRSSKVVHMCFGGAAPTAPLWSRHPSCSPACMATSRRSTSHRAKQDMEVRGLRLNISAPEVLAHGIMALSRLPPGRPRERA